MQARATPTLMWWRSRKGERDQSTSRGSRKGQSLRNLLAEAGGVEEGGGEEEGADGDEQGGGDDEDG